MSAKIDLSGQTFGDLKVLKRGRKWGRTIWECSCVCGETTSVISSHLHRGDVVSCGCRKIKHGDTKRSAPRTKEWLTWAAMIRRCSYPSQRNYKDYGARGIKVCKRWADFANFLTDMGRAPSQKHSIDRVNSDGDYEPSNCRWSTSIDQNRNRTVAVWVLWKGERRHVVDLAEEFGLKAHTLRTRLRKGWEVEKALTAPLRKTKREFTVKREQPNEYPR